MNAKVIISFCVGALTGAGVAYILTKRKYEHLADEEVASLERAYNKFDTLRGKTQELVESTEALREATEALHKANKEEYVEYTKILEDRGYVNEMIEEAKNSTDDREPIIIAPDEFGLADGYSAVELEYFMDGILADDFGNIIDDPEETIGIDALTRLNETADTSVCVRNDRLKSEFEVLYNEHAYYDAYPDKRSNDRD